MARERAISNLLGVQMCPTGIQALENVKHARIVGWSCLFDYDCAENRITQPYPVGFNKISVSLSLPTCIDVTQVEISDVRKASLETPPDGTESLLAVNDQ